MWLSHKQSRSRSFEKSSKDQINYEMSSMRFHKETIYQRVHEPRNTPKTMLFDVDQTRFGTAINQKAFRIWKGPIFLVFMYFAFPSDFLNPPVFYVFVQNHSNQRFRNFSVSMAKKITIKIVNDFKEKIRVDSRYELELHLSSTP
ncbi:hypothetical protein YC2023_050282 [Brassica napus]